MHLKVVGFYSRSSIFCLKSYQQCNRQYYSVYKSSVVKTLIKNSGIFSSNNAIIDTDGAHSYKNLLNNSLNLARVLNKARDAVSGVADVAAAHVSVLCDNNRKYVTSQWACWMSGCVNIPLSPTHPMQLTQYYITDSSSSLIIIERKYVDKYHALIETLGLQYIVIEDVLEGNISEERNDHCLEGFMHLPDNDDNHYALIIYTSGTTGPPKGVVLTHNNIHNMAKNLVSAWGWSDSDCILHVLPLYHVHGLINCLLCPLYCGATCMMLPKFDEQTVWNILLSVTDKYDVNVFMAVPTIYVKLLEHYHNKKAIIDKQDIIIRQICERKFRLMVSGSAALPNPIFNQWYALTGHKLLERYGMTEIGMALSNPLYGERKPGHVGHPLPDVEVRLVSENGNVILEANSAAVTFLHGEPGDEGEIQVKGPSVFECYWNREEETTSSSTPDGWFKTGDTGVYVNGSFKMLGRTSVDVIKSGGYKLSALDIERELLSLPWVADCAVVGARDEVWGQRVAAVIAASHQRAGGGRMDGDYVRRELAGRLPSYSLPTIIKWVDEVPRNNMGKVNKKLLLKEMFNG